MAIFFKVETLKQFSLDELKQKEQSQASAVKIFSFLAGFFFAPTLYFWAKQDFSFDIMNAFNPVFYCLWIMLVLSLIAWGLNDFLKVVRKEINSRQ